jgi:hypothetical protein
VSTVKRRDLSHSQPLRERDDSRIRRSQRKVAVRPHELGRPPYVRLNKLRQPEITVGHRGEEQRLDPRAGIARQEVADLGQDRCWHE